MVYCETLCCAGVVFADKERLCATCKYGKLNVVLDLDETLVHTVHKSVSYPIHEPFMKFEDFNIYKRPHVDHFLEVVFKRYNVFVWTAAYKSYANEVLAKLFDADTQKPICVLTRNDTVKVKLAERCMYTCYPVEVTKIKPLSKLATKCALARTIMIDDTKSCFSRNRSNGLLIKPFDDPETQSEDCELLNMLDILDILSDLQDVRNFFHKKLI